MSAALSNAIRQHARAALSDLAQPNIYLISSYDGQGRVKVTIRPAEGDSAAVESNWMPLGQIGVGNSWGVAVGPQIGDQVMVVFEGGDINSGTVVARIHSTQAPSMPVPSGEIWMVHATGSLLKILNNGDVQVSAQRDILASAGRDVIASAARNFSGTFSGYAHITATTEITLSAPIINLNGALNQTTGAGSGASTMQGTLTVAGQIKSNTEVMAQTTPLHTHQHLNGGGVGNSGNPTP